MCPSESQQNGTAERMHRTLVTGARTVLLAGGLERVGAIMLSYIRPFFKTSNILQLLASLLT